MRQITVSIINYKTAELTLDCLQSILENMGAVDVQVVVVDNDSGDGSEEIIDAWIKEQNVQDKVMLIRSKTNSGFSGGHNQAMLAAPAQAYLIFNSDALLRPGALEAGLKTLQSDEKIGIVGFRLEDLDETPQISCFRFASPRSELIRGAQTGFVTKYFKKSEIALSVHPDPNNIEWVSFASVLLKHEMLQSIGPMDDGYFLYFEDEAYCLSAKRAGWRILYEPQARAVHLRGGSSPVKSLSKAKKRLPKYFYASRTRFMRQAHGIFGPLFANIAWNTGRIIACLRLFAGRNIPKCHSHEAQDIWTNFLSPLDREKGHRK